jgi:hypothetical protein
VRRAVAVCLLSILTSQAAGCFSAPIPDPRTACSVGIAAASEAKRGDIRPRDLVELSSGSPRARRLAESAYHQGNTITAVTVMGAAALVSGLVMGFAADPTRTEIRNAGYGLVGTALGLGALAIGLGYSAKATRAKAIAALLMYAQSCSTDIP